VRRFVAAAPPGAGPDSAVLLAPTRGEAGRLGAALAEQLPGTRSQPLVRTPSSLAFAILRRAAAAAGEAVPRLLTGAEQDTILRELLEGHAAAPEGAPTWPTQMHAALGTAGFRGQLRDLLMRAAEHGVGPEGLRALGERHGRAHWVAASEVLREYEQVTALATPSAFDPATICGSAAAVLETDPELRTAATSGLRLLVVDDAQELTASAAHLIRTVVHGGVRVLLTGDGDAAVQGFRGALPRRFLDLADELADARVGSGAAVGRFLLSAGHRQPEPLNRAAGEVVRRIGLSTGSAHRAPPVQTSPARESETPAREAADAPGLEVAVMPSGSQEAELVAHRLRQAHLLDGVRWSQMAVVARSGSRQDAMRRALQAAGVPARCAAVTGPLASDPAVRPFLLAYDAVLRWCEGDVDRLEPDLVTELLTSPIGAADPVVLRRLRRAARRDAFGEGVPVTTATSTDALLGQWVLDPAWLSPGLDLDPDM